MIGTVAVTDSGWYDFLSVRALPDGVLLRADLHRLFDKGYVTITPDYCLEVSSRLKADYSNGRSYYPLNGQTLRLPRDNEGSAGGGVSRVA